MGRGGHRYKMNKIVGWIFFLGMVIIATDASPIQARKKDHPGCAIWWFFPECPLARLFGADPFKIYPWKKFCKVYSSIEDHEVCRDFKPKAVSTIEITEENQSRSETNDELQRSKAGIKR